MSRLSARTCVATIAVFIVVSSLTSGRAIAADDQLCDVTADFALGREDYPTAITLYRRLLKSQPNDAVAHYHLSFAYGMQGRDQEELTEYLTSVHLGLKNWELFLNLGLAYLDQRELARATEALETAVAYGPEHAEAHFNLAIVYESQNRLGAALREITVARRLAPSDLDAANTNAIICAEMGDIAGAHDIWTHLVQSVPDYAPARANLSILDRSLTRNIQPDSQPSYADSVVGAGHPVRNRDLGIVASR
jgi:tetratricopeptide (TPR) repeat protein